MGKALISAALTNSLLISVILMIGTAAYFLRLGIQAIQPSGPRGRSFGWGRILIGTWIIGTMLRNHFYPSPNLLNPSNEAQAVGMAVTNVVIVCIGLYLIVRGIVMGVRNPHSKSSPLPSPEVVERAENPSQDSRAR